ncbi:hypothetical protein E4U43_002875 [Claviceps pusilla]|uniref:AHC1-like C2H2 zinc-finger domain-containing protein n=1 Tax=Claviceps pusilla TaxID=123648 RepID=A0A9P7N670_9HYPO|nr:hypothetical protein E4U43_002875 [Claviceps pusilla]
MFRFWSAETRGSDQTADSIEDVSSDGDQPIGATDASSPPSIVSPAASKRRWASFQDSDTPCQASPLKRTKLKSRQSNPAPVSVNSVASTRLDRMQRARDVIGHQIGLEVLLKHDELRLINQELAKCQIALEQLRRCHLIPYPQHCPTPHQMLDISTGKGPAVNTRSGEPIPQWAPPFGVVDGPYARHYAKWLVPDPSFDGAQADWQIPADSTRSRLSLAEGRQTRNSFTETGLLSKGRPVRGNAGQKLQALSNGYPQPKDKAGPCVLKRSDGQTVKLVCLDCHRENFSSTQGFINHCRIAHKRDFKSHEEAAVQSGQPIETSDKFSSKNNNHNNKGNPLAAATTTAATTTTTKASAITVGNNKASLAVATHGSHGSTGVSTLVHPFARQDMSESDTYLALQSRIADSLKLYHQGKLPGVGPISLQDTGAQVPGAMNTKASPHPTAASSASGLDHDLDTPYLFRLMQTRKFDGNLCDVVADAKTKVSLEDMAPDEESDDNSVPTPALGDLAPARTPVVAKRVPAQSSQTTAAANSSSHSVSSKSRAPPMSLASAPESTMGVTSKNGSLGIGSDEDSDDMEEANLSPNPLTSNIAPSLVSDDGEYDDSDDGSSISGGSDDLDADSVSDVAEITLDDETDARTLRRASNGAPGTVRLRKHDAKKQHVTFLGPVKKHSKKKRSRRN